MENKITCCIETYDAFFIFFCCCGFAFFRFFALFLCSPALLYFLFVEQLLASLMYLPCLAAPGLTSVMSRKLMLISANSLDDRVKASRCDSSSYAVSSPASHSLKLWSLSIPCIFTKSPEPAAKSMTCTQYLQRVSENGELPSVTISIQSPATAASRERSLGWYRRLAMIEQEVAD